MDWLNDQYETLKSWLSAAWEWISVKWAETSQLALQLLENFTGLDFIGVFELFVIGFALFLFLLIVLDRVIQAFDSLPEGHYQEHPTMIQGRLDLLFIFVSFGVIGTALIALAAFDFEFEDPSLQILHSQDQLGTVGFFYIFACLLSFLVWGGVSRSEVVTVDNASIVKTEMFTRNSFLNLFLVLVFIVAWLGFIVIFHAATLGVFLIAKLLIPRKSKASDEEETLEDQEISGFINWGSRIWKAKGKGERGIAAGGATGFSLPERNPILQIFNIGHIEIDQEGRQDDPLKLHYMPNFKGLRKAIERITALAYR